MIKNYVKKVLIIILIVFIIVSISIKTYATSVYQDYDWYSADPTEYILNYYENISYRFLYEMYKAKDSSQNNLINLNSFIERVKTQESFYIVYDQRVNIWRIYFYNMTPFDFTDTSLSLFYHNGYVNCPTTVGTVRTTDYYTSWIDSTSGEYVYKFTHEPTLPDIQIPACLIYKHSNPIFEYISVLEGTSSSDLLTVIEEKIIETNSKLNTINNSIGETNNWLKNEDDSDIIYQVDTPSVDSSSIGSVFDGIFSLIYNKLTTASVTSITIPLPHSNTNLVIPSNLLSNIINNSGLDVLVGGVVSGLWYFLVCMFILKDLAKIMQDIKSGDIMSKTDIDIKADML